jgi:RNA-directed DNA polymerase
MKRIGNLYPSIYAMDNLERADKNARKGKAKQYGVIAHDLCKDQNLQDLNRMLRDRTFETSAYTTFIIFEPKRREIYRLPYYPDRILHHAIMNVLEPIWMQLFTADTYSCIKGRGIHSAANKIKEALRNKPETLYCLKLDVKKFYPNVDHDILKSILRKKIKDLYLLDLLDSIIDSAVGLPIGNYLSQYLANLYLTYFDHWLKEKMKVKHYFRYCDDLVILAGSKCYLHSLLAEIRNYLQNELKLTVKENYQVFPVDIRGIDFVGYRFFRTHTLLRKSIKKNFARAVAKRKVRACIAAYLGWAKHANCKNLIKKLANDTDKEIQRIGNTS